MSLTKDQKRLQLEELKDKLGTASSVIYTQYIGMTVGEIGELRRKLKKAGAEMKVAKKTLMRIAAEEKNLPVMEDAHMIGPVACIFSYQDPTAGAQAAYAFSKDHQQVKFLGGLFEGKLLSKQDAMALATIPSRQVLLGTFAGMIRSPLQKFASICNSPLGGFARALKALGEKGGVPAPAAA